MVEQIRLIRMAQLAELTTIGESTLWDKLDPRSERYDPAFPRPIKIGRATCFFATQIAEYLATLTSPNEQSDDYTPPPGS